MIEAVLASHNTKKLTELRALFEPLGYRLRLLSEFTQEAAEEPAPSFVENALFKARHAAQVSGLPALADDSGIEVDALEGAPGVRSARYAGDGADDEANNRKLLAELAETPASQRGAGYVCVLAFMRHARDPAPLVATGTWRGRILEAPRGDRGFGYDPLFWVDAHGKSAAELEPAVKNRLSHRARAAAKMLELMRG